MNLVKAFSDFVIDTSLVDKEKLKTLQSTEMDVIHSVEFVYQPMTKFGPMGGDNFYISVTTDDNSKETYNISGTSEERILPFFDFIKENNVQVIDEKNLFNKIRKGSHLYDAARND